jgi:hypothetical protein
MYWVGLILSLSKDADNRRSVHNPYRHPAKAGIQPRRKDWIPDRRGAPSGMTIGYFLLALVSMLYTRAALSW